MQPEPLRGSGSCGLLAQGLCPCVSSGAPGGQGCEQRRGAGACASKGHLSSELAPRPAGTVGSSRHPRRVWSDLKSPPSTLCFCPGTRAPQSHTLPQLLAVHSGYIPQLPSGPTPSSHVEPRVPHPGYVVT